MGDTQVMGGGVAVRRGDGWHGMECAISVCEAMCRGKGCGRAGSQGS